MFVVHALDQIPKLTPPLGLTLGSFDGIHLGHQFLIKKLRTQVTDRGSVAVLTFSRHPAEILQKRPSLPPLCSLEEKKQRLQSLGVDLLILLDFTSEMAELSYKEFIDTLRKYYPFSILMLGQGAAFGKNRMGDKTHVQALGQQEGFEAIYLEKFKLDNIEISSGMIRELFSRGEVEKASKLLG